MRVTFYQYYGEHFLKIENSDIYYIFNKEELDKALKYLLKRFNYSTPELERKKEIARKSYRKHKSKRKLEDAKRRGKLKQITHAFTLGEWEDKVKATNGICPRCKMPYMCGHGLSLDHEPPISKAPVGFIYTIDDVQPMCKSCNCIKSNK